MSKSDIRPSICRNMKAASGGSATQEIGPVFLVGRGGVGGGRPVMLMLENVNVGSAVS